MDTHSANFTWAEHLCADINNYDMRRLPLARIPDLEPRPLAHCFDCGEDVHARQTWKNTPHVRRYRDVGMIGKYRQQYVYTCPNTSRRHRDRHHLVIPYRRGEAKTTSEPVHTVATKDSAALVKPALDVMDCRFRMFCAREHLRAQRFPDSYIVHGTGEEQTMQAGNAVSANVAHWIGRKVAEVLA
jgi:site-specific DNA-cytosine methylase